MPEHPSLPSELQGAVDLGDIVQQSVSQFKLLMAQQKATAVVLIGQTGDGGVALSFHAPNGTIQAFGLLAAALAVLGQKQAGQPT